MAKSPSRSNREIRKPKALKARHEAVAVPVVDATRGAPQRKPKGRA